MTLTIVDYNAGNLRSVQRACDAVGIESVLTKDPEQIRRARRVIFPGVGNAESAMRTLTESGIDEALREALAQGIPILGICVGAQLILDSSEESQIPCLGLLPGQTKKFRFAASQSAFKVPHIGWNEVRREQPHYLLDELQPEDEYYFVHSYFPAPARKEDVFATTDYGGPFCCALGRANLFATQFHPEKSGKLGLNLLRRFSHWEPKHAE